MILRQAVMALLVVTLFSSAAATAGPSAGEIVKLTADSVIQRLEADKVVLQAHPERVYELIQETVLPHFDFNIMSKWILGKSWAEASEAQQQAFIEQFQTLLIRTYAKALLEYSDEIITYHPEEAGSKPNLAVVRTEVSSDGTSKTIPIDYRMYGRDGVWKVIDVSVDGVSLVGTYRGSFSAEIRKNGMDALIAKLTERNSRQSDTQE